MSHEFETRLADLGLTLPEAAKPAANYVPYVLYGTTLHIAGQLPIEQGKLAISGHLGGNVELAQGQRAAELCAINLLSQAKAALNGDLSRIVRIVKLNAFVASTPDFVEQHLVVNGASNLLAKIFGDSGKHARSSVGVAALPLNAAVEIDAIMEVRP